MIHPFFDEAAKATINLNKRRARLIDAFGEERVEAAIHDAMETPEMTELATKTLEIASMVDKPEWAIAYLHEGTRALLDRVAKILGLPDEVEADTSFGTTVPDMMRQATFQEARNQFIALADGPSMRRWEDIPGEIAMRHVIPDQPLQTKFSPGASLTEWWGFPATQEDLRKELANAGLPAVLMANVAVGLALGSAHVRITPDQLGKAIGLDPRSTAERLVMRRKVWRWLLLLDSLSVIGKRDGRWTDPRTKKVIETVTVDAFIRITGKRVPAQTAFDGSEPPSEVTFVAGPWLEQYRGNRQFLSDFGDVLRIAKIPAGKPSGAWAQSIGLALNQRWRERAHDARVTTPGESNSLVVHFRPFTRADLLDLFRAEPYFRDVLNGDHPRRAVTYWNEAIQILKQEGTIGRYAELEALPSKRKGWQDAWLKQPLDIRPSDEAKVDVVEIARKTATARRARKARRPSKASPSSE